MGLLNITENMICEKIQKNDNFVPQKNSPTTGKSTSQLKSNSSNSTKNNSKNPYLIHERNNPDFEHFSMKLYGSFKYRKKNKKTDDNNTEGNGRETRKELLEIKDNKNSMSLESLLKKEVLLEKKD